MEFKKRTLKEIANMICGNSTAAAENFFRYRSGSYLTEFFQDCGTDKRRRESWMLRARATSQTRTSQRAGPYISRRKS
jgi:hypothetical protein